LDGTKEEHLDMLDGGIIQKLLEEKWKTFARVCTYTIAIAIFIDKHKWFYFYFVFLFGQRNNL